MNNKSKSTRVLESDIDSIFEKHFSKVGALSIWLFSKFYGDHCKLSSSLAKKNVHNNFTLLSGDSLAYGETDVEVLGVLEGAAQIKHHAILIENKVDSDQMPNQGLRYQARARFMVNSGKWQKSSCILVAPQKYLDSQYPRGGSEVDGWDALVSLETIADVLVSTAKSDANVLRQATTKSNSSNEPIPAAVDFWHKYENYQRSKHPDVLLFLKSTKGSKAGGVWPSFYDSLLRDDKSKPDLKRVQVVHIDTSNYVTLFIKKVNYADFKIVVDPILDSSMRFGKPAKSWQSVQLPVPSIDVQYSFEEQKEAVDAVFLAAEHMYNFFKANQAAFMSIPVKG